MATKTGRLKIPFKELINIIDHLSPEEKIIIKKRLANEEITTWKERFGRSLKVLGRKNIGISETEVKKDVDRAIAEVRGIEKDQGCS